MKKSDDPSVRKNPGHKHDKSSQVKSGHSLLMENFTPFFTYFVECKPGNMDRNGV